MKVYIEFKKSKFYKYSKVELYFEEPLINVDCDYFYIKVKNKDEILKLIKLVNQVDVKFTPASLIYNILILDGYKIPDIFKYRINKFYNYLNKLGILNVLS